MKLNDLIKSKTREKLLRFFFKNKKERYYLRELERALDLPVGNIRRELISLEKSGLFKKKKVGNLVYYYLNEKSPFFEAVEGIVGKASNKKSKKRKNEKPAINIKNEDVNLLLSRIRELEHIVENISNRSSEIEDFLNLGVVVNGNNEVLMVKRIKKEKGVDGSVLTWAFPGGKQRFNESRKDCVVRGVLSETGYKIKPKKEVSFRFHPQFPVFIVYHFCKLSSKKPVSEPKQSYEISEVKWVKLKDLKNIITTNLDFRVAKELGLK